MKKAFLLFAMCVSCTFVMAQAKYVFYFIGDGMGLGAVTYVGMVLSAQKGEGLSFSAFPHTGFVTTHAADSPVTCSATETRLYLRHLLEC